MRKIIPLIVLMLLSVLFTMAQNLSQAEADRALQLVDANKAGIGLSADVRSNFVVSSTFEDRVTGKRYVYLFQAYKGIPVFNQMLVLSFKNGKLSSKSGIFDPEIERAVGGQSGSPSVTAESAVQSALSDRGFRASQMAIAISSRDQGRFVEFGNMGISQENITAQLMWVPIQEMPVEVENKSAPTTDVETSSAVSERYKLAWQVYIIPKTTSDYWLVRVNAADNSILGNTNLTDYDHWGTTDENANIRYPDFAMGKNTLGEGQKNLFDFNKSEIKTDGPTLIDNSVYRVIPIPYEAPTFMPGAPTTWHATRANPWTNATVANATTLKWHTGLGATDYEYSRGNNVWAYQDRTPSNNTGSIAKSASSTTPLPGPQTYDFTPDYTLEPTVTTPPNQQFNITNLFYWNNLIHDIFYGYGFTEAGGNFQDDNLGRGGVGNDHVNAEAQDGSGSNNANFSTPADGGSGRMQMYLWTAPTPDRDGDVDNGIIIHEFGHGISKRITGGPANTSCLSNSEHGGEGISDYFGLMLTQDWTTATVNTGFNTPRGIGTYALNQPTTGTGIRPQRYCTDFAINNATYATLPGQAIPHGVGWVWCSMMWEVTWEIIKETNTINPNIYAWNGTEGNVRALRIIMEALRTQPCSPGFVDARNHILLADTTLYGGIYGCAIWRAFARRGVGFGALQGSVSSINDQTPSFAMPPACGVVVGPTVTINQAAAQPDPTSVSPINFTVVFSEPVIGFATGDVTLGGTAGATTGTVTGSGATYNVAVSGMTSGGTVIASIAAGVCTNAALDPNNASTSTDNTVTFLLAPPGTCTTFVANITTADPPTSLRANRNGAIKTCAAPGTCLAGIAGSFNYQIFQWTNPVAQCVTVTYSATNSSFSFLTVYNAPPVLTNLCTNWVSDPGASPAVGTPRVFSFNGTANTTYYFLVTNVGAPPSGSTIDITAPNCSAPANNPTVTINQAAAQPDPTSASPINFTAVFNQPVIGFATGDVTLSGTAGATLATVSGGPSTYNIAVTGMTSTGTVIATIAAGVCTNAALDPNNASTSTDNTVTFNLIPGCTTVDPIPSDTLCNGSTHPAVVFTSPTAGTVFSWVNNNPSIGLAASGTGNLPSFVATNTGTAPVVATVTVTPSLGGLTPSTFSNTANIEVPAVPTTTGIASPYPSPIVVSGLPVTGVTVESITLNGMQHSWANDIEVLLVGPGGQHFVPLSDVGGSAGFDVAATITIKDGSPAMPTTTTAIPTGTYGPTSNGALSGFPVPAPAAPYNQAAPTGSSTFASIFNSTTDYNGTWNLFVKDDASGDFGSISGGWSITLLVPGGPPCSGNPRTFNITVDPTGQVNQPANQVVCKGAPTAPVNFTSTVPGTVFTWSNDNPAVGLAAAGIGNIASFIAQNPGTTPLVATITVTPRYGTGGLMVVDSFLYSGAVQTWVVPAGVTSIKIKSWGGQGNNNTNGNPGGLGGYAEGDLAVTPGQTLYINVGGGATTNRLGAFNGGGNGGVTGCATAMGGGGGGASDVRVTANTLANRRIVAGGGGGAAGDRIAGCGRGTGGGGGGGYYGGGGGAGWPLASTIVPTGGTQTAGGIGGTSTFTGAPGNNGFPGALGAGGNGGNEVASNQGTPSRVGPVGGTGGGLVGGNGVYVLANTWTGQSGAGGSSYIGGVTGGVTTSGLRTGSGRINIEYAAGGISCIGAPKTFTITVSPNPSLIIVADPGTTICEGDPTLLTVYNSAGFAPISLTQSSSQTPVAGSVSCNAGGLHTDNSYWRAYNLATLGLPSALTVNTVTFGIERAAGGNQPVTVNLYTQNAGPAFPGGTRTLVGSQAATVPNQTLSNFTVTFATPVVVPNTAVLIVELFTPSGQATGRSFFIGSNPAAQTGASYLSAAACGVANPTDIAVIGFPNMRIILNVAGTVGSTGSIATGTFLWSPAAGLSSTTSNPVAAAPMNTTTYTVVRTTVPGGCIDSARVTITVNKRPTVTSQPVSTASCQTLGATFTVGGTGTGLTYQWQVNTAGCTGGTWTNLANGGSYSGVNTATLSVNPTLITMNGYGYRCVLSGVCAPILTNNISNCAVLTVNPLPVVAITPANACGGVAGLFGTRLSVGSAPPPVPGSCTTTSAALTVAVPDNTANGAQTTLAVSCVPANATITGMRVNFNMPAHTYVGDMIFNLKAPNGTVLNLVKYMSGTATQAGTYPNSGFVNTTISSSGTTALGTATTTPITGTWRADLINGTIPFTVQDPAGFPSTATAWSQLYSTPNGTWTLAMADGGPGDVGTLTSWSITFDYTTPGGGGGPVLTYVWSPLAGLYTDSLATIPYAGSNTPVVYAAPTLFTTYTVVATNVATGCIDSAKANVNYTPPPPTVTPASVTMCLGDPAVKLKSSSSSTSTATFTSGTVSVPIPEGAFPTGPYNAGVSTIPVSGIPAGANISRINVRMNITHAYVGDVVAVLQAPNGQRINLDALLNSTNNPGANFVNTVISSAGTTALSAGAAPWTGTFRADLAGATFTVFGFTLPGGPIGYIPTSQAWSSLYSVPNGTWTLALYDAGAPDVGTLTNWSLDITYVQGVPATSAVWTPAAGLFSDAAATIPYVAGTEVDSVWTQPTPSGVYNYNVTVQSLPIAQANPGTPTTGGNGQALVTFNVTNNNPYPVAFSSINSRCLNSGNMNARVFYKTSAIAGAPGAISAANGWTQFGSGASVSTANQVHTLLTGLSLVVPPGQTYGIALEGRTAGNAANIAYTNGGAIATYTDGGMTITVGGNVGYGGVAAPGAPTFNPRNFNGSVLFAPPAVAACTSPARKVVVTVNQPTTLNPALPVNQTVCTDKVATFSVAVTAGTGPHSYQWQVSTDNGNNFTNITNGGVYSGATTATLTITAPPVSMNRYQYRSIVQGASPCGSVTSRKAELFVNPLPTVVISASPLTSLFPGLTTTLSSTVTPNAAATYTWIRDGVTVAGANGATLGVNIDGLGDYSLRVTDVNGCTNTSNTVTIKDSVSGKCFLYPNPTGGQFQVRYYSVRGNILPRTLTVYDAKGDRVFTQLYSIGRPYDRMDVDMRAYGKGLYWVEIGDRNGDRLAMCRVVIQ